MVGILRYTFSKHRLCLGITCRPQMHFALPTLDGENVLDCEPMIGYLHRGMEKIAESRTNVMFVPYKLVEKSLVER